MSAKSPRLTAILLAKNAEKHLIDWLSWHLALGIHDIMIADAGSSDGTRAIIQDLSLKWPVRLLSTALKPDLTSQERRLLLTQKALETISDRNSWVLFLDIDEYLCPDTSLDILLERARKTGTMAIRWCISGAGAYQKKTHGHPVATHGWRAVSNLPDHKFVRILTQRSKLKPPSDIKDPITLDTSPKSWLTASGRPWSRNDPIESLWEGGRILHYICSNHNQSATSPLSSLTDRYYSQTPIRDITGFHYLGAARQVRNHLLKTVFDAALLKLRKMVSDRQWVTKPAMDTDLSLPDNAERFGFSYKRVRMSEEEARLISPQAFPPMDITRAFILRTPGGVMLEADKEKDEHKVMLCLVQDRYPQLAMLFCMNRQAFTLNDVIACDHYAVTFIHATARHGFITLPAESGREGLYFEMISSMEPQIPDVLPLPSYDEPNGLSLKGFLEWLFTHPEAQPYDIRRGLLLLTKEAAERLGQNIPSLQPFMMQDRSTKN